MFNACPQCGGAVHRERDSSSGNVWRSYFCTACGWSEDVDEGVATWKVMSEAVDEGVATRDVMPEAVDEGVATRDVMPEAREAEEPGKGIPPGRNRKTWIGAVLVLLFLGAVVLFGALR